MSSPFEIVAEPARRALLDELRGGPRPVGELARLTGLSQPNTSRHLRIMREAGIVTSRTAGQRRLYALQAEGLAELAGWLTPYVLILQRSRGTLGASRTGARSSSPARDDPR
jgi:DNA-binding transcriptional ArsR family regulator